MINCEKARSDEEDKKRAEKLKRFLEEEKKNRKERQRLLEEAGTERQRQKAEIEQQRAELQEKRQVEGKKYLVERRQREEDFKRNMGMNFSKQVTQDRDTEDNRWIKCELCGKIAKDNEFASYVGTGHITLETCRECYRNNPQVPVKVSFTLFLI